MYLQAYVRDEIFLDRLKSLLISIDPNFYERKERTINEENNERNEEIIKEVKARNKVNKKETDLHSKKRIEKDNEKGREKEDFVTGRNENEKWMKKLRMWSYL